MTIVERFRRLGLPAEECVVIGSGVLDALNLRRSGDIDLVVSEALFARMRDQAEWQAEVRHDETVLLKDDVELWCSWGSGGVPNFAALYREGIDVQGVRFATPEFVLRQKRQLRREKDVHDIHLLEEYLNRAARN